MIAIIVLLLTTQFASAQQRDLFPWWDMPIARDLNLTEEQNKQIHSTVREYRDKLVDLRGALEKSENQLSDLMNEEHPDAAKVNTAIDRMVNARSDLAKNVTQMSFKLRMILTPSQWKQLQNRPRMQPGQPGQPGIPNRPMQPNRPIGPPNPDALPREGDTPQPRRFPGADQLDPLE